MLSKENSVSEEILAPINNWNSIVSIRFRRSTITQFFLHLISLLLLSNDKEIRKNDKVHGRKLWKLIPNIHKTRVSLIILHIILIKQFVTKVFWSLLYHFKSKVWILPFHFRKSSIHNFWLRLNSYSVT